MVEYRAGDRVRVYIGNSAFFVCGQFLDVVNQEAVRVALSDRQTLTTPVNAVEREND